jgi:NAD(P)-dependent dehydrogenase (short-subunit alcohol dehydrogenase family)
MNLNKLIQMYDFTNRTVLVTGGAGVLGIEIVRTLAECNANVVVLSRKPEQALKSIDEINQNIKGSGHVLYIQGDVLSIETLQEAHKKIQAEFSAVDILINAAGGNYPSATTSANLSFFDLPLDALRYVNDLNLLGTILPCQVFGRAMAERGEGVILNVSSMNTYRPLTRTVGYAAAKAAVANFTQWLAVHMAQNYSPHIRVNALAPGFFVGNQNRHLLLNEDGSLTARGKAIIAHTPMNRFGTPEDLIGATMWLLSPASAFVTGAVIPIDGGFSAFGGV